MNSNHQVQYLIILVVPRLGSSCWGGSAAGFYTYSVSLVKHGGSKSADYSPTRALPLKPEDIINVTNFFYSAEPSAHVLRVATLIGYFSFFRQSNLLPSGSPSDSEHWLMRSDVNVTSDGITIQVHSTKTTWGPRNSFQICLPSIPGSMCCPQQAWLDYIRVTCPVTSPSEPAFKLTSGRPLTRLTLTTAIHLALSAAGHSAHGRLHFIVFVAQTFSHPPSALASCFVARV